MSQGSEDNSRRQPIEELLRLRQSIDKAWSTGLDDTTAAETLDALVDLYRDVAEVLIARSEGELAIIRKAVNRAAVLAMKVWDGIAQQKREEGRRAVTREDLPADLTAAIRLHRDAEELLNKAIDFSKLEDARGLSLYEEAVEKFSKASDEVLLVEQGTKGIRRAQREEGQLAEAGIKLSRWQVLLAVLGILVAVLLSLLGLLKH